MICVLTAFSSTAYGFIFPVGGDQESRPRSEVKYAVTPDGWKIALEHVPPAGGQSGRIPVILCHGLGYNGDFWMLSNEVNLPRHLSLEGYDVWILSLRGAGKSTKWVYKLAEMGLEAPGIISSVNNEDYVGMGIKGLGMLMKLGQAKMENASANPKYINWTFDDYVKYDVPTAIDYVKKATGSPEVFWVGHSMGGNVLLAHLARYRRTDVRGAVTVGSQLTMVNGHIISQYINTLQWLRLSELAGGVEAEKAKQAAKEQARALLFYGPNMEGDVVGRLENAGTDTPAVGVLGQYLELVASGQFKTADNKYNYAQNAKNISIPLLACAGSQDSFVNPNDLTFLRDNVSSGDFQTLLLGPSAGMDTFGHNDALISRRASSQVYPLITEWLDKHADGRMPVPAMNGSERLHDVESDGSLPASQPQVPVPGGMNIPGSQPVQSLPRAQRVIVDDGANIARATRIVPAESDDETEGANRPLRALPVE